MTTAANGAPAATTNTPATSAEGGETLLANNAEAGKTGAEAEGAKPDANAKPEGDKPQGDGDKGKGKDGDKPAGAPEKYEFTGPEGMELDTDLLPEFEAIARELDLPQDKAQALVNIGAKIVQKQQEAVIALGEQWAETAKTDKEFGGDKLQENLSIAKLAIDTYGTPELRAFLNETRFGNHPEMIRFALRAGKPLAPDKSVRQSSPAAQQKSAADTLYGSKT